MKWSEVKVGDVIDGCTITEVEDELDCEGRLSHKTFTFNLPNGKDWSFLAIWPMDFEDEANLEPQETEEEPEQMELFENEH